MSGMRMGTYAEYVTISERMPLVRKTDHLSFEEAAALSVGGFEALHFHQRADIKIGQRVLINGAGGSIGTIALQLAKMSGAEVTCVDSSHKLGMLKELGAHDVIDYARDDFTKDEGAYDVVFDLVGKTPYLRTIRALKKKGRLILGNSGYILPRLLSIYAAVSGGRKVMSSMAVGTTEELERLRDLVASGKVVVRIDERFPLERTADAHRYIEAGRKKGNVIITVIDDR